MHRASKVRSISPHELYRRWQSGDAVEIIDVRLPAAFAEAHVPIARSAPFRMLNPSEVMAHHQSVSEEPLYIICQIGRLSVDVCKAFVEAGLPHVVNVEGGTDAWQEAGFPVVSERRWIPLRRQVQLVTGTLVLAGSALGLLLHPLFVLISAIGGAGLIYTGATDTCAMGMLLARMHWNRSGGSR